MMFRFTRTIFQFVPPVEADARPVSSRLIVGVTREREREIKNANL